jgi:hypothetical protein
MSEDEKQDERTRAMPEEWLPDPVLQKGKYGSLEDQLAEEVFRGATEVPPPPPEEKVVTAPLMPLEAHVSLEVEVEKRMEDPYHEEIIEKIRSYARNDPEEYKRLDSDPIAWIEAFDKAKRIMGLEDPEEDSGLPENLPPHVREQILSSREERQKGPVLAKTEEDTDPNSRANQIRLFERLQDEKARGVAPLNVDEILLDLYMTLNKLGDFNPSSRK